MGIATEPQFHVLAVDDSLIDRKLIERLLKSSSYQVTTVDSGCKALEFLGCQENPLDSQQEVLEVNLIITDYCMPGMTGYDLLKKVKESSSLRNIPVVIMSSENVPSRITRCLEEGAEEFFLKPVRLADVNRLRHHMLRTKYELQQQNLDTVLEDCQKSDRKPDDELKQQPHEKVLEPQTEMKQQMQQEQPPPPLPVTPQQNNTKRKSMEDGLSPDRTRPRYNGLTTVI